MYYEPSGFYPAIYMAPTPSGGPLSVIPEYALAEAAAEAAAELVFWVGSSIASAVSDLAASLNAEKADSKKLKAAMEEAGIQTPNYPYAAHHIVAGDAKRAQESREKLIELGIGINDAVNGVYLPTDKNTLTMATYHPSLHTNVYYDTVNERLRDATTYNEGVNALNKIRNELLNGTFPYK